MSFGVQDFGARRFLFLQGPHGPFFGQLGAMLAEAGAQVRRVGFNRGDQVFWPDADSFIPWRAPLGDWPVGLAGLLDGFAATDLVLYGDTRPVHTLAVAEAKRRGLTVHVFEEGYLRPWWVTYERGGSNGNSRLMEMPVPAMRRVLAEAEPDRSEAPAHWGDMRQHMFYGALYHFHVLLRNRAYAGLRSHREESVGQEFRLYLRRIALAPLRSAGRIVASHRIAHGGFPYHLCLLQLAHDSSFRAHSPFTSMEEFLTEVIAGFAAGAPRHHHLVFKAHPLEDGRFPLRTRIRALARAAGVEGRTHFLPGGKLARLLDHARSAVTVNSTAGQQALWRGLPLRIFGRAVYGKPEFVSQQPLAEFFAAPRRPDRRAYAEFRQYLLETSQVAGGFYSARGRRQLLRQVVDMMLAADDPYEALERGTAAPRQHLRVIG